MSNSKYTKEVFNYETKIIDENDNNLLKLYYNAKLSKLLNNNMKNIKKISSDDKDKYKIAFVTFENRNEPYVEIHNNNINNYCKKWGYEYIFIKKNNTNISPYWYKVLLINHFINTNKYDYVVWLDSDTIINNMNIDIGEDIIFNYTSDIFCASDNITFDVINSGVFIIKNSEIGKQFLKDWINSYNNYCEDANGKLKGLWALSCYEQGNMNKLIIEKYSDYTTLLNRHIVFNSYICSNNVFIMHLYASNNENRVACFRNASK